MKRVPALVVCGALLVAWAMGACSSPSSGSRDGAVTDGGDARGDAADSGGTGGLDAGDAGTGGALTHDASPWPDVNPDGVTATAPSVLMRSYNLQRTGTNLSESVLQPSAITPGGFGKLFCKGVDDQVYGQILYMSSVDFGARGRHNVIYAVTMNDSVYALDADDPLAAPLWQLSYVSAAQNVIPIPVADLAGTICSPYRDIVGQVGITSTPAIDPATMTMYLVARTREGAAGAASYFTRLHAISLIDGGERPGSPVVIDASAPGTGDGATNGMVHFDPLKNNQRAALLLYDGIVYIGFSSHCDQGPYHGWLLGYDARSLTQQVVFVPTPNGSDGGIWMSGNGPAVDTDGSLYLVTGNGSADLTAPGPDRAQAFLRLMRQGSTMAVVDWFTPANYAALEANDRDLGSTAAVLIPGSNMVLSGNKDGSIYVLDRNNMGHFNATDNNQILQTVIVSQPRGHIHGTPVYWKSMMGEFIYVMAEEDYLRQYQIVGGQLVPYKVSQVRAPIDPRRDGDYTMPGGVLSLSAAGDLPGSGLLWLSLPVTQDANHLTVSGLLRVFDADDVTGELWDSEQTPARDSLGNYAKFNPPTVANGKAYVATFSNQICVYGKLN